MMYVFLSLEVVLILADCADPDVMHFNWVFTVCQSTSLGFQVYKRVTTCMHNSLDASFLSVSHSLLHIWYSISTHSGENT